MQFLDFELEITADDEVGYTVAVIHSPAGEARGAFEFPFSSLELEKCIVELQNALLRSGGPPRRTLNHAERTVQDFGRILFDTLFAGEIKSRYDVSRQMATGKGAGLRVKLRIEPAELAALPWEFLYDPRRQEYVSLSRNTPIVRYLSLPRPVRPLSITPPLRILGMVASPGDQDPLDVALEQERLRRALQGLEAQGLVTLDWLEGQS